MMKNLFKKEDIQFNEILFEGRNKAYGAYDLRMESDRMLTRALFVGLGLFVAVAATPFVVNAFKSDVVLDPPTKPGAVINIKPIHDNDVVVPPKEVLPETPQVVQSKASVLPTPTNNPPVEKTVGKVTDPGIQGFEEIKGVPPESVITPPKPFVADLGTGKVDVIPAQKPVVSDDPVVNVDVEADFMGGVNSFRNKVMGNFDTNQFEGSGDKMSAVITFIVERDGSISSVKAAGKDAAFNREAERTIKSVKGKWTPAKVKGQAVRSYFKFPISMMFE